MIWLATGKTARTDVPLRLNEHEQGVPFGVRLFFGLWCLFTCKPCGEFIILLFDPPRYDLSGCDVG